MTSGEQRVKGVPVGGTRVFPINLVSIVIYLLLAGVVVLLIWRMTGYQPLQGPPGPAGSSAAVPKLSRAYVVLGVYQGKLYFFDEQAKTIVEYDSTQPHEQRQVGSLSSVEAIVPSPRGDKLALVSTEGEKWAVIYVLDLSSPQDLILVTEWQDGFTPDYSLRPGSAVSWSPDGAYIAFVAYKDDHTDLFLAQSDGTSVRRVTYHGASIGTVVWINQEVIAFVSDWEGQDMLYLIDRDGGNLRRAR
jgi:Tol biopolymer transport system component